MNFYIKFDVNTSEWIKNNFKLRIYVSKFYISSKTSIEYIFIPEP